MGASAYNPFEPGFAANPYAQYERIRAGTPAQRTAFDTVLLHRYDDCFEMLRMPGTSVEDRNANMPLRNRPPELAEHRRERGRHAILNLDPPDHTRIRRLVSGTFTVRRLEALRPRIRQLVDELLDELETAAKESEPIDLMSNFAFPLPFQVITDMLGMPDGDRDQLREWSHTLTRGLEPLVDDQTLRDIFEASDHMDVHIRAAIEEKRANPRGDLLSALVAAEEDGDKLSTPELVDQIRLIYIAGHETTVNLIGNGTLALLRNRDQLEDLGSNPDIAANAVDELLRWDSPVQVSRRIAMKTTEIAGETIEPGEVVITVLGAANRDPNHWGATADQLNLRREGASAHLSFGSGIHHCLGAALARLEGSEAISALVRRFPNMELATDNPAWNGRVVLRGLDTLPLSLAA